MSRHADVTDFSRRFRFQQGLQRAAGGNHRFQLLRGDVVDLIQVNIVRAQIFQALFNVRRHGVPGAGHALGGNHKLLPDALKGVAQIFLTDGVSPGGVDEVHPGIPQFVDQRLRPFRVNALDGNAAKAHTGDLEARFS